jgi:hemolysin III
MVSITRHRAREPVSGYTHLGGLLVGCLGALLLLSRARGGSFAPNLAYVLTLLGLYAASSAYHLVPGSERLTKRLRQVDHAAIFLFIAGSCTPIFWRAFEGGDRGLMLGVVWAIAAIGIVFRVVWMNAPRALYTSMYVAMGWLVLIKANAAFHALSWPVLAFVIAGGLTYMLGALVYATKRPNPLPSVFGFHEIWHIFVLAGSALHYAAIFVLSGRGS